MNTHTHTHTQNGNDMRMCRYFLNGGKVENKANKRIKSFFFFRFTFGRLGSFGIFMNVMDFYIMIK